MTRDWNSPEYVAWRRAVRRRARNRCQLCGAKKRLECHHLRRWADAPHLRFALSNSALLCKTCHKKVTGNEALYQGLLSRLNGGSLGTAHIQFLMDKYTDGEGETETEGDKHSEKGGRDDDPE